MTNDRPTPDAHRAVRRPAPRSLRRLAPLLAVAVACSDDDATSPTPRRAIAAAEGAGPTLLAAPAGREGAAGPRPAAGRPSSGGPLLAVAGAATTADGAGAAGMPAAAVGGSLWILEQEAASGQRVGVPLTLTCGLPGAGASSGAILAGRGREWIAAASADFDGDGVRDVVWENTATGEHGITTLAGADGTTPGPWYPLGFVDVSWHVAAAADFTGDGKPDLLWENTSTGERGWYPMNGTSWSGQYRQLGYVDAAWRFAGAADVTQDQKADIVWQNLVTGERGVWPMLGLQWSGHYRIVTTLPVLWRIAAVADANGDGHPDLLWQNVATGERRLWAMREHSWTGNEYVLPSRPGWSAHGVVGAMPWPVADPGLLRLQLASAPADLGAVLVKLDAGTIRGFTSPYAWHATAFGTGTVTILVRGALAPGVIGELRVDDRTRACPATVLQASAGRSGGYAQRAVTSTPVRLVR